MFWAQRILMIYQARSERTRQFLRHAKHLTPTVPLIWKWISWTVIKERSPMRGKKFSLTSAFYHLCVVFGCWALGACCCIVSVFRGLFWWFYCLWFNFIRIRKTYMGRRSMIGVDQSISVILGARISIVLWLIIMSASFLASIRQNY